MRVERRFIMLQRGPRAGLATLRLSSANSHRHPTFASALKDRIASAKLTEGVALHNCGGYCRRACDDHAFTSRVKISISARLGWHGTILDGETIRDDVAG